MIKLIYQRTKIIRLFAIMVSLLLLSSCGAATSGFKHGYTLSKYEGKWWKVIEDDSSSVSGYKRLNIEIDYDPTVEEHVKTEGLPNYIHVVDRHNLKLIYLDENKVYWFKRPSLTSVSQLSNLCYARQTEMVDFASSLTVRNSARHAVRAFRYN